ncbi:MAG TPA: NAD(P)H-hydrate dehydratase [Candidatus Nanoarchaeia archaeon]|nr:NAD(P)H-hydrate dehydratase [Candidatus Nanoarchaeia archaeon]
MLKPRKKSSHKGDNGNVVIIGGSEDYIGAPTLVGMAALATLRSGADLVTVIAPEKVAWAINCIAPDIITKKIPCKNFLQKNVKQVLQLTKNADVVEIGNGIAFTSGAKKFMQQVIKKIKKPMVIDAAALRVIRIQDVRNSVLLPHAKEYEVLLKNSRLKGNVQKYLGNNILVKKGHPVTAIISKNKIAYNKTGNAGMTHGGTGDVLAGIVSALIAQGNDAFMSAYAAVYVNGKAAELLYKKMGFGYLASDLIQVIPQVLRKFQKQI